MKIPYQMIKELHQKPFQKFRQPQSKEGINALDESIGFSFNRMPAVESTISASNDGVLLTIKSFSSKEPASGRNTAEKEMTGFQLLSAVFIDRNYNGKAFEMTDYYFLEDIKEENGQLLITLPKASKHSKMMVVYTDVFGNDLTESFEVGR